MTDYDPVLSPACFSGENCENCDGRAVIRVGEDEYSGKCQHGCHNSLEQSRRKQAGSSRVEESV